MSPYSFRDDASLLAFELTTDARLHCIIVSLNTLQGSFEFVDVCQCYSMMTTYIYHIVTFFSINHTAWNLTLCRCSY